MSQRGIIHVLVARPAEEDDPRVPRKEEPGHVDAAEPATDAVSPAEPSSVEV
jgi:hypothetical protein